MVDLKYVVDVIRQSKVTFPVLDRQARLRQKYVVDVIRQSKVTFPVLDRQARLRQKGYSK